VPGDAVSPSRIRMASGEVSCRTAASAIAQRGAAARPRHQLLTWRHVARDAREGGLADVGAGEQGGELGVQEHSHGTLDMEVTSIARSEMPCREATHAISRVIARGGVFRVARPLPARDAASSPVSWYEPQGRSASSRGQSHEPERLVPKRLHARRAVRKPARALPPRNRSAAW
jgi:hypothetical protein